jgi:poly-gamma-glutamate synthesis protein (capsule biosynthesis protein)
VLLAAAPLWVLAACAPRAEGARLVLLGDIMLGRGVAQAYDGDSWEHALQALSPFTAQADLTAANLESPLTSHPSTAQAGFDLRAPPESVRALSRTGVSLVSLANNHILDGGQPGLVQTLDVLRGAGIGAIGPTGEVIVRQAGGVPLAFLAFDDVSRPLDLDEAAGEVRRAREQGWLVVVSIHWGREYLSLPDARQEALARALADAGASVIWGHHPHVVQSVGWLQGGSLPYPTLVAYSLGNVLFDQAGPPDTRRGAALGLTLGSGGAHEVQAYAFVIDPSRLALRSADPAVRLALEQRLGPAVSVVR